MAFLDEEEQIVAPEEPERPRRAGGAQRRRQQFLLRRLIATGAGVAVLILMVVAVRGCLEARSDRGLSNYAQGISTDMQESQQRGKEFFDALQDSSLTEEGLETKIRSIRANSASLLDRADNRDAPSQMGDAHSAATLSLRLRRDALEQIAANIGAATADEETADAVETIVNQMGSLYSSDILWSQLAVPEIGQVLEEEDVEAQSLPPGNFMPSPGAEDFLDQTEVVSLIGGISGDEGTSGEHGLGLVQTAIGDVTLSSDSTTELPDDAREVAVQVQNQGEAEETGVSVLVTVNGEELEKTLPKLQPGATETVRLQLATLPQPGSEASVEVLVEPVPGEQVSENNEASYTVIFGTPAA